MRAPVITYVTVFHNNSLQFKLFRSHFFDVLIFLLDLLLFTRIFYVDTELFFFAFFVQLIVAVFIVQLYSHFSMFALNK